MKIDILSDFHVEFNGFAPFYDRLKNTGSDVLICAGDMGPSNMDETRIAFRELCKMYKKVIYTPGNHDYYGSTIKITNEDLRSLTDWLPNLDVLFPGDMTELDGYKVIGGTLWVPMRPNLAKYPINDPFQISDLYDHIDKMHKDCVKFIDEMADFNTIVVTHHLPSAKSIAPRFIGDQYNCWFASDLDKIIEEHQPAWWIHGHTHDKRDYYIGKTRIICNPYGYPSDNRADKFGQLTYY